MVRIESIDDPRIAPYRNLKDRELAREGGRFIAEGELILRRLAASDYPVESVLLAERRAAEIAPLAPAAVPVYVAPETVMRQIIGYRFQSGVAAVGIRKPYRKLEEMAAAGSHATWMICPETASAENMGSLIRIAAAFGADAMLMGERCCDPFWRQSIRVSMGTVFSLPLIRSDNLLGDLAQLKTGWDFQLIATVLDQAAEPLQFAARRDRIGILFGNEAQGLDAATIAACDRRVTIPMRQGIDSLNVAICAGIVMHHFAYIE